MGCGCLERGTLTPHSHLFMGSSFHIAPGNACSFLRQEWPEPILSLYNNHCLVDGLQSRLLDSLSECKELPTQPFWSQNGKVAKTNIPSVKQPEQQTARQTHRSSSKLSCVTSLAQPTRSRVVLRQRFLPTPCPYRFVQKKRSRDILECAAGNPLQPPDSMLKREECPPRDVAKKTLEISGELPETALDSQH